MRCSETRVPGLFLLTMVSYFAHTHIFLASPSNKTKNSFSRVHGLPRKFFNYICFSVLSSHVDTRSKCKPAPPSSNPKPLHSSFSVHLGLAISTWYRFRAHTTAVRRKLDASRCAVARKAALPGVGGTAPSYSGISSPHWGSTRQGGSLCRTGCSSST